MHFWYHSTSFFIPSKKKLFVCSQSHVCTACWTSPCKLNHYTCYRESLVFSDQGIHPLDVLVRAWCRCATSSAFICYTCSSLLKALYPLIDLSLMHGACSILCQHPEMDFCRFKPLCPQKTNYGVLFHDGAIAEWSGHTYIIWLLSAMWLNDGMLRAANYTSSLAHMWCCASAPLSFLPRNFKIAFTLWFNYV
jgi:hypothetical protein